MPCYDRDFYFSLNQEVLNSARVIVPKVMSLVHPRSVVDIGCGVGTWLNVFRKNGVYDVVGVDGDYVDRSLLEIPEKVFQPADLRTPLRLARRFDLACSLEVAEHLPVDCAGIFIETLARLAPMVLFSAAVPHQGGVEHVNEQWQDYWEGLFKDQGYLAVDCLRAQIWNDQRVAYWYAQNTILYVEKSYLDRNPKLKAIRDNMGDSVPRLVHPKRYLEWVEWGIEQSRLLHDGRA